VARAVVDDLRSHGRVRRGWLGVSVVDLTPDVARSAGRPSYSGVMVSDVVAGSPAQRAGLRTGDIILDVDHVPVQRAQALRWRVAQAGPGNPLRVHVTRSGRPVWMAITPETVPTIAAVPPRGSAHPGGQTEASGTGGSGKSGDVGR